MFSIRRKKSRGQDKTNQRTGCGTGGGRFTGISLTRHQSRSGNPPRNTGKHAGNRPEIRIRCAENLRQMGRRRDRGLQPPGHQRILRRHFCRGHRRIFPPGTPSGTDPASGTPGRIHPHVPRNHRSPSDSGIEADCRVSSSSSPDQRDFEPSESYPVGQ